MFAIQSFEHFVHLFSIVSLRWSLMIQQMLRDLQTPVWLSGREDLNCNECAFRMNTLTFCSSLWTDYWQMPGITFHTWWSAPAQSNITAAQDPQALAAWVIQIFQHRLLSVSNLASETLHVQIVNYCRGRMWAGCGSSTTGSRFAETSSYEKKKRKWREETESNRLTETHLCF